MKAPLPAHRTSNSVRANDPHASPPSAADKDVRLGDLASEGVVNASDDSLCVAAALSGDREAFGRLVERYQDRLYNTLWRMSGSHEDARDAVQDAFVQAFVKLDKFRGASQFYTWIYRIAVNQCLNRRRRRRPTTSLDGIKEEIGSEPLSQHPDPTYAVLAAEEAEEVQRALDGLGDEHRRILVLREMEGCSYEQIAEILELPLGTVRSRLFRARLQMRDKLQATWKDAATDMDHA